MKQIIIVPNIQMTKFYKLSDINCNENCQKLTTLLLKPNMFFQESYLYLEIVKYATLNNILFDKQYIRVTKKIKDSLGNLARLGSVVHIYAIIDNILKYCIPIPLQHQPIILPIPQSLQKNVHVLLDDDYNNGLLLMIKFCSFYSSQSNTMHRINSYAHLRNGQNHIEHMENILNNSENPIVINDSESDSTFDNNCNIESESESDISETDSNDVEINSNDSFDSIPDLIHNCTIKKPHAMNVHNKPSLLFRIITFGYTMIQLYIIYITPIHWQSTLFNTYMQNNIYFTAILFIIHCNKSNFILFTQLDLLSHSMIMNCNVKSKCINNVKLGIVFNILTSGTLTYALYMYNNIDLINILKLSISSLKMKLHI